MRVTRFNTIPAASFTQNHQTQFISHEQPQDLYFGMKKLTRREKAMAWITGIAIAITGGGAALLIPGHTTTPSARPSASASASPSASPVASPNAQVEAPTTAIEGFALTADYYYLTYPDGNPYNPGTGEEQFGTPDNVVFENGMVHLITKKEKTKGYDLKKGWQEKYFDISSPTFSSKQLIQPPAKGQTVFIEATIDLSAGKGFDGYWPAFTLYEDYRPNIRDPKSDPFPSYVEKNIMEIPVWHPQANEYYVATKLWNTNTGEKDATTEKYIPVSDLWDGPHKFATAWSQDENGRFSMIDYLDGKPVNTETNQKSIPKKPVRIVVDVAIRGGASASIPDGTTYDTPFGDLRVLDGNPYRKS